VLARPTPVPRLDLRDKVPDQPGIIGSELAGLYGISDGILGRITLFAV